MEVNQQSLDQSKLKMVMWEGTPVKVRYIRKIFWKMQGIGINNLQFYRKVVPGS